MFSFFVGHLLCIMLTKTYSLLENFKLSPIAQCNTMGQVM